MQSADQSDKYPLIRAPCGERNIAVSQFKTPPPKARVFFIYSKEMNKISGENFAVFRDCIRGNKPVDRFSVQTEAR